MGCRIEGSGIKTVPGGITLPPKSPCPQPTETPHSICPGPSLDQCDVYGCPEAGTPVAGCSTGLPLCPPDLEVNGQRICPPCAPPDGVSITATPRDPYYVDALAIAMDSGDQTYAVRVTIDGNIPLVRPVSFRHAALPGVNGVPNRVRSDIETHELEHQAINMYSTIPQTNGETREVAVIDRFNNRWVIVTSVITDPPADHGRMSPAYFARGRGVRPWWKTGYHDGTSSTGLG